MQRAFQREWADGEPQMMANFLIQLGSLPNEKLKTEQLRELRELQLKAPALLREHLAITMDLCQLLFNSYNERDDALRQMEIEMVANILRHIKASGRMLTAIFSGGISLFWSFGQLVHAIGEQLLQTFIARPANDEQRTWLNDRLLTLYNHALENDGAVSIGTVRARLFLWPPNRR